VKPLRVLHVITRLDRGGSATNTLLTVGGLPPAFQQSLLFGRTESLPALAGDLRARVPMAELPALVRPMAPWSDLRALGTLVRRIRRGRFDLVHTHASKAGILGRLAARLAGVPRIVHTPHGHVFTGYAGRRTTDLFVRLERWAATVTDRIVTLTDQEARDHLARGIGRPGQFVSIPSGIDAGTFEKPATGPAAVRVALGLPPSARLVGTVGRLTPIKGQRFLVDAFAGLAPRLPDLYLVLIGDGELAEPLRARARAAGVGDRVRFLGWRDDLPDLLHALDVFVLPSLNEGMGRALVEAMAAGRPIVASRAGGIPEVLADGQAGLLVEPANAGALAEALARVLGDPALAARLAEAARPRAERYSIGTMLGAIEALYRELAP
jgi:glycosyltransferase involved in cell wall biosynthesis